MRRAPTSLSSHQRPTCHWRRFFVTAWRSSARSPQKERCREERRLLAESAVGDEPCQIVVTWSQTDLDHLRDIAEAWDVTPQELQQGAGRLILAIIYATHVQSG